MKTAIVLVTYNKWELTHACLNDLMPLLKEDFLIVVADNASTDGTPKKIREMFPEVFLTVLEENLGFGTGNNRAIEFLRRQNIPFDALCFLNNDTRLAADSLMKLREACKIPANENLILSPVIRNTDGTEQAHYFQKFSAVSFFLNAFRSIPTAAKHLHGKPSPLPKHPEFLQTSWTSAVCWWMSNSVWEQMNGFDEHIFMYYEDTDFAWRFIKNGGQFLIYSPATIIHLDGGSAQSSFLRARQHDRSQEYIFKKHFGIRGVFLSRTFRAVRSLSRILCLLPGTLFSRKHRNSILIHARLLKGTLCGS